MLVYRFRLTTNQQTRPALVDRPPPVKGMNEDEKKPKQNPSRLTASHRVTITKRPVNLGEIATRFTARHWRVCRGTQ